MDRNSDSRSWKRQWMDGVQIIICFSFAITVALAPASLVEMLAQSGSVNTLVRVLLILLAVAYSLSAAPIFTVRIIAWLGFSVPKLDEGQKSRDRQE